MRPGKFLKGLVVTLTLIGVCANVPMAYAGKSKGSSSSRLPDPKKIAAFWIAYAKYVQKNAARIVKIAVREALCEADFYCRDKNKSWKGELRGGKCTDCKWDGRD